MSMDRTEDNAFIYGEPWDKAVEKLYKEMYPVLNTYAMRILKDNNLVEEAIQDAFCIACAKREQFLSSENPQGWIMLTLKNVMQNMQRSLAKRRQHISLDDDVCMAAGPSEFMSVDLLFGDVSESADFQILKRIAIDQCTIVELSEELGVSVEACKKRVQRARKRLRKKLEL